MNNLSFLPHDNATEPIIAWRIWQAVAIRSGIISDDIVYRLRAVAKFTEWKPRISFKADCFALVSPSTHYRDRQVSVHLMGFDHPVPDISCKCGIYALRTKEAVFDYFAGKYMDPLKPWTVVQDYSPKLYPPKIVGCTVFGQVSLWGEIIEGEEGYRAEYAYPYDLTVLADDSRIADSLREQYQVDVKIEIPFAQRIIKD